MKRLTTLNMMTKVLFLGFLLTGMTGAVLAQQGQRSEQMQQRMEQMRQHMEQMHQGMMQQRQNMQPRHRVMTLPGLTDEQREQIRQLHLDNQEAVLPLQNELGELRARLNTLSSAADASSGDVSQAADRIGAIQAEIIKRKMETHRKVRDVLTEEQRVVFDTWKHHFMNRDGMQGPQFRMHDRDDMPRQRMRGAQGSGNGISRR